MNRPSGLGKGLAALIPPGGGPSAGVMKSVPLDAIASNPRQPREVFDLEELEGLAASIKDLGLLQPVVVRSSGDGRYELVAGERRLRAARMAGLDAVPAIIRETEDDDLLKEALVENIHRVQLHPLEEAAALRQLLDDFGVTHEELAHRLGKSRPAITNTLRLLTLPPSVQRRVAAGVLSAGHAKALLGLEDTAGVERLAGRIVAEGLSVRATEEIVRLRNGEPPGPASAPRRTPTAGRRTAPALAELERTLTEALEAPVAVTMGARKGRIQVEFRTVDELERLVAIITRGLGTPAASMGSTSALDAGDHPVSEPTGRGPIIELVEPVGVSTEPNGEPDPPRVRAGEPPQTRWS